MVRKIKTWTGAVRHCKKNYGFDFNTSEKSGWDEEKGREWFSFSANHAEYDTTDWKKGLIFVEGDTYLPGCPFYVGE